MGKIIEKLKIVALILIVLFGLILMSALTTYSNKKADVAEYTITTVRHNGRTYDVFNNGMDIEVVQIPSKTH